MAVHVPLTTYQKTNFTDEAGQSFRNGFFGPESFSGLSRNGSQDLWITLTLNVTFIKVHLINCNPVHQIVYNNYVSTAGYLW